MPSLILAVYVVVVVGTELSPEHAAALEESCAHALGGTCRLQSDADTHDPNAVAIVSLDSDQRVVTVEVGKRRHEREQWVRRRMTFAPEDEKVERFRAIGLTIATLVGDVERATANSSEPTENRPAEIAEEPRPVPLKVMAAASAFSGPGLDAGSWRIGAGARALLAIFRLPLQPTLGFAYSTRGADEIGLSASWWSMSAGARLGYTLADPDLWAALRAEAVLDRLRASQSVTQKDSGGRWNYGARIGIDVVWPATGTIGALLQGDAWFYDGSTSVRIAGQRVGAFPARTFTVGTGIELRFR